jgi:hypothetical protein
VTSCADFQRTVKADQSKNCININTGTRDLGMVLMFLDEDQDAFIEIFDRFFQ